MSETQKLPAIVHWFEIAVADYDRAVAFYQTMLGLTFAHETVGEVRMAMFPADGADTSGALAHSPDHHPGAGGTVVYLNARGEMPAMLERAAAAGGAVLVPRTEIPGGHGFFAVIRDSEGNAVGLHEA